MRITKYPEITNTEYTCKNCGCNFTISKRDVQNGIMHVEDRMYYTKCPCCNSLIPLIEVRLLVEKIYSDFEGILRGRAEEIKQEISENDSQIAREKATLLDEIYVELDTMKSGKF